jgi:hypothetical protein
MEPGFMGSTHARTQIANTESSNFRAVTYDILTVVTKQKKLTPLRTMEAKMIKNNFSQ